MENISANTLAQFQIIWYYIPTRNQSARGIYVIKCQNLSFTYSSSEDAKTIPALSDVNIEIKDGEFVAILGRNGSGKSTLARHLNALLTPTSGSLWVRGLDTSKPQHTWDVRQSTGMVFQNPDNQIIATLVEDDVAFGPENLGVPRKEIIERVDTNLAIVDMSDSKKTAPHLLSGGQKQRVAIAGILAMKPSCIIFDEATAMLDPSGRKEILKTAHQLNKEEKITIILITHLMEEALEADRIIVMNLGKVEMDDSPRGVFADYKRITELGLAMPNIAKLGIILKKHGLEIGDNIISEEDFIYDCAIQKVLLKCTSKCADYVPFVAETKLNSEDIAIEITNLTHTYNSGSVFEKKAISEVSLSVQKGELAAIIGHTGSGKSTLIQHLNALLSPSSGTVKIEGENIFENKNKLKFFRQKVGIVFQYPEHQLFEATVLKDVSFGPAQMKVEKHLIDEYAKEALESVGIGAKHYDKSPFELSGGQKRRVAIAGVLAMRPSVLILDEPTAGLDPSGKKEILTHIKYLHDNLGITIILVSHSMDDVAEYASKIYVMNDGKIMLGGTPREVFGMGDVLKSIGLDVPKISSLFISLNKLNPNIPKCVITLQEAEEAFIRLLEED